MPGYAPASRAETEAEWQAAAAAGARPLLLGAAGYPPLLATISDPPPFLWSLGDPAIAARPVVGLVGARNASALGVRMASQLARELGEMGVVVASGLARGIDAAAHRAALATGTIAAQAGGVDAVYPPENAGLAGEIAAHGLRLSEMPMGHAPRPQDFPRRNRIVSGLALGIVVVEGALRSGSLITARNALDQGREVMAVPGNPMDARAGGCNQLIRDGATLVRSAADVAEALAVSLPSPPRPARRRAERAAAAGGRARREAGRAPRADAGGGGRADPRPRRPGGHGRRGAPRSRDGRAGPAPPRRAGQPRGLKLTPPGATGARR